VPLLPRAGSHEGSLPEAGGEGATQGFLREAAESQPQEAQG